MYNFCSISINVWQYYTPVTVGLKYLIIFYTSELGLHNVYACMHIQKIDACIYVYSNNVWIYVYVVPFPQVLDNIILSVGQSVHVYYIYSRIIYIYIYMCIYIYNNSFSHSQVRLEFSSSAVWETYAFRHNVGPIQYLPQNPGCMIITMFEGFLFLFTIRTERRQPLGQLAPLGCKNSGRGATIISSSHEIRSSRKAGSSKLVFRNLSHSFVSIQ